TLTSSSSWITSSAASALTPGLVAAPTRAPTSARRRAAWRPDGQLRLQPSATPAGGAAEQPTSRSCLLPHVMAVPGCHNRYLYIGCWGGWAVLGTRSRRSGPLGQ